MANRKTPPLASARRVPLWMVLAIVIALAVPVVWALVPRGEPLQEALYDPYADQTVVVRYKDREWVPASQPVTLQDENMAIVGESEGYQLYANNERGVGGGAGPELTPERSQSQAMDRVYLKVSEGRYVPLMWKEHAQREQKEAPAQNP